MFTFYLPDHKYPVQIEHIWMIHTIHGPQWQNILMQLDAQNRTHQILTAFDSFPDRGKLRSDIFTQGTIRQDDAVFADSSHDWRTRTNDDITLQVGRIIKINWRVSLEWRVDPFVSANVMSRIELDTKSLLTNDRHHLSKDTTRIDTKVKCFVPDRNSLPERLKVILYNSLIVLSHGLF